MEIPAGDAFHESFLLFAIREFQIGREISRYGKCLRFGARLERLRRLPWFVAPDPERACVGRLRSALRAEEALGHVPPALRKLCSSINLVCRMACRMIWPNLSLCLSTGFQ